MVFFFDVLTQLTPEECLASIETAARSDAEAPGAGMKVEVLWRLMHSATLKTSEAHWFFGPHYRVTARPVENETLVSGAARAPKRQERISYLAMAFSLVGVCLLLLQDTLLWHFSGPLPYLGALLPTMVWIAALRIAQLRWPNQHRRIEHIVKEALRAAEAEKGNIASQDRVTFQMASVPEDEP